MYQKKYLKQGQYVKVVTNNTYCSGYFEGKLAKVIGKSAMGPLGDTYIIDFGEVIENPSKINEEDIDSFSAITVFEHSLEVIPDDLVAELKRIL